MFTLIDALTVIGIITELPLIVTSLLANVITLQESSNSCTVTFATYSINCLPFCSLM
jgi:hypothetical protein